MKYDNHILVTYPDEDLFEDGELSNDLKYQQKFLISEVEQKIIWLWRNNKAVLAKWEELK